MPSISILQEQENFFDLLFRFKCIKMKLNLLLILNSFHESKFKIKSSLSLSIFLNNHKRKFKKNKKLKTYMFNKLINI